MAQKEVVDNVKLLDQIEAIMQPIRLEYVRLKRNLDSIQIKYDNILYEHEEDLDQTELTVENQVNFFLAFTGWAIKNWSHSFNHTFSHDKNPSNFNSAFICYLSELSFKVYNSFLGQLAKKWGVIKV